MEAEKNISGISQNLSDSIAEQQTIDKKPKGGLYGMRIAISVSENEDLVRLGLSEHHLKDISIEIARYLIVNGAKMLYGGDLRNGGFTELFSELSYQYKYLRDKEIRFINYFPFPNSKSVTEDVFTDFIRKQVEPKIINFPESLGRIDTEKEYKPSEIIEDRFIIAECLKNMRMRMATDSAARIVIGGKLKNFNGYFPGIVEETLYSLKEGKAVYFLGGFGGATKCIIDIISGLDSDKLTNNYQFDTEYLRNFRVFATQQSDMKLDYNYIIDFFKQFTIDSISKLNGLSVEDNKILFESTNINEIVFLIIKGLQNISYK